MPKLFQPKKEKPEKKEKKKSTKKIDKNEKLKKVTEKLADNPEVVKMIQEETEDSSKNKSKKSGKKKLFKIMIPVILVIFLLGGAFFAFKSGLIFSSHAAQEEDNSAEKSDIYIQAETYYSEGCYYDASALFSFLGEYEDSIEMAAKIDLNSKYPDNGAKISEYIGSDVVNNYISSYKNHSDITTELENATNTTTEPSTTTEVQPSSGAESSQPSKKGAPNPVKEKVSSTTAEESAPTTTENASSEEPSSTTIEDSNSSEEPAATEEKATDEKIEYDEAVVEAVKVKTHELIIAGDYVKNLNLSNDNILFEAQETLKRSADYSNQAAEKILEGVEAGTYKPGGSSELSKEVTALIDNMNKENDLFRTQIEEIISSNILLIIKHPNAGELMNRYSESIYVLYAK